jgi:hypothetical protein
MSAKHKHWIMVYLLIGVAFVLFRRYVVGATVDPLLSGTTLYDLTTWPVGAFQSANLYYKTGSLSGGPVKK